MDEHHKCPDTLCPGDQDLKRVIVAATIDTTASGGERPYQELQGDIVDPDVKPVDNPVPPGTGDEGTFATFYLTDTPCDEPERLALPGDHVTHNTLGTCDAGVSTGVGPGAPDLMYIEPPPLDPAFPDDGQPEYDYATDVEPAISGGADKGLQLRKPGDPGCASDLSPAESNPHRRCTAGSHRRSPTAASCCSTAKRRSPSGRARSTRPFIPARSASSSSSAA